MEIVQIPASPETYTKGRGGHAIEAIVVHYTGGEGGARDNGEYFSRANRNASAHYFLDGREVVQSVPDGDTARAVGNFNANQRSVSIEVCSAGEDFSTAEILQLRELVQTLRARYGIPPERVIRHYDAIDFFPDAPGAWVDSHKHCPAPYVDHAKWHNDVWLRVAPDGEEAPAPEPDAPAGGDGDFHGGLYTCMVDALNVRSAPSTSAEVVARYHAGQTVELDDWYQISEGIVWARYTAYSGATRYVAVGPATGRPEGDDYLIKA